jgi:hypothetical protein
VLLRRAVQHAVVVSYLVVTAAAFVYTMTRVRPVPYPLWPLVQMSYGMMAPYQGDTEINEDLIAEGKRPDGKWERIHLDPYFPVGFGEKNVRKFLRSFKAQGTEVHRRKYTEFAWKLLERERRRGRPCEAVRLLWQEWERSPAGFHFLQHEPFVSTQFITQVQ